ncbi:hypothetical protein ACFW04_001631 [Cataglyphis niger]
MYYKLCRQYRIWQNSSGRPRRSRCHRPCRRGSRESCCYT